MRLVVFILFFLITVTGCFHNKPVRHLAADACLISPDKSTRQDVLSYLGEPDERLAQVSGGEVWIYYQANKSLLRKTPYIGKNMGHEEYDILNITFNGNLVTSCNYRLIGEKEFKQSMEAQAE